MESIEIKRIRHGHGPGVEKEKAGNSYVVGEINPCFGTQKPRRLVGLKRIEEAIEPCLPRQPTRGKAKLSQVTNWPT